MKLAFSQMRPAIAVSMLFAATLPYSGAGFNLHWLSLACLLVLAWITAAASRQDFAEPLFSWGWLPALLLAYLGWLMIEPLFSTYPYASSTTAMGLAILPLTFFAWLLTRTIDKQHAWRQSWRLLLVGAVLLSLWGMFDFLVSHRRAHAVFLDPNAYAALINLFLVPIVYQYLHSSPSPHRIDRSHGTLGLVLILALALSMSQSRGALVAFLAILPLLLWFNRRHPAIRVRFFLLLVVLVSAYSFVKATPSIQKDGIESLVLATHNIGSDAGIQERILLLKSTWRMIEDTNLLLGDGLGTFKIRYPAYRDTFETSGGNFAHNDYAQALQEGGVIQLAFFLAVPVFAPILLIYRRRSEAFGERIATSSDTSVGLLLGVLCISLHAAVNFIHYVGPLALLTGLYLARAWESFSPARPYHLPHGLLLRIKPAFLKLLAILLLAVPTAAVLVDGVIFKLFGTDESIHARLEPGTRFTLINLALSARPQNPYPRILLIRAIISAAENEKSPVAKNELLDQAEREIGIFLKAAPGLPAVHFLKGQILALRGSRESLEVARHHLEQAVRLVPPATGMRLALINVYQRLGQEKDAYLSVLEAKKWTRLEIDQASLAAFAKEAQMIATKQGDLPEAQLWSLIHTALTSQGEAG